MQHLSLLTCNLQYIFYMRTSDIRFRHVLTIFQKPEVKEHKSCQVTKWTKWLPRYFKSALWHSKVVLEPMSPAQDGILSTIFLHALDSCWQKSLWQEDERERGWECFYMDWLWKQLIVHHSSTFVWEWYDSDVCFFEKKMASWMDLGNRNRSHTGSNFPAFVKMQDLGSDFFFFPAPPPLLDWKKRCFYYRMQAVDQIRDCSLCPPFCAPDAPHAMRWLRKVWTG